MQHKRPIPIHHTAGLRTLRTTSLIALALLLAAICLLSPLQRISAAGEQVTVTAQADTYIDSNQPTQNFSSASEIELKDNPPAVGFLRFSISGMPQGGPLHARLRLFVPNGSDGAAANLYVFRAPTDWDEHILTWNLQPALGDQLGVSDATPLNEGTWVEIDLGGAVSGDGLYSFAITSNSPDRVSLAGNTRTEAAELVVAVDSPPTATPEASATPQATATPDPTSSAEPTTTPEPTATPPEGAPIEPTSTPTS